MFNTKGLYCFCKCICKFHRFLLNYFKKVSGGYVYKQTFMDYLKNIFKHDYVISEMNKLKDGEPQIKQTEIIKLRLGGVRERSGHHS